MSHIQPDTQLPTTKFIKTWIGNITQDGTSAPVVNQILQNTLGATLTWVRADVGYYTAQTSIAGIFEQNNVVITISNGAAYPIVGNWDSTNKIYILTYDDPSTQTDGILQETIIEIRVYSID